MREGAGRVNVDETVERIVAAEREAIRKRALADLTPQLNEAHRRADELETKLMLEQLRWEQEMKALRFKLAAEKAQAIADARVDADREAASTRRRGNEITENRFFELQSRYDALVTEVEMLRAQRRTQDESIDEWKRRADERTREVDAAAVRLLEAEKLSAQERLRLQRDHRFELESAENTLRDSWREAEAEVRRMHDRAQEERARNHAGVLAEERRSKELLQDELTTLRRALEETRVERDRAGRELATARDQVSQQIREIEDLHAQLRNLQDESSRRLVDDKEKASKGAYEQRQQYEERIRELEQQLRLLQQQTDEAEQGRRSSDEKLARALEQVDHLTAALDDANGSVQRLKDELAAALADGVGLQTDLERTLAELELVRGSAGDVSGELNRLREDLKDADAKNRLLDDELVRFKKEQVGMHASRHVLTQRAWPAAAAAAAAAVMHACTHEAQRGFCGRGVR